MENITRIFHPNYIKMKIFTENMASGKMVVIITCNIYLKDTETYIYFIAWMVFLI